MNDKTRYEIMKNRELLKGYHAEDADAEETDQQQKLPSIPCLQAKKGTDTITLPTDYTSLTFTGSLMELIAGRESRRSYGDTPLSLLELSFLLWSTQGVRRFAGHKNPVTFRNVPSAGGSTPSLQDLRNSAWIFSRSASSSRSAVCSASCAKWAGPRPISRPLAVYISQAQSGTRGT